MSSVIMTTRQIWSCHVSLAANFENFYFSPNSILNIREKLPNLGEIGSRTKSYRQKAKLGVENTTPPLPVLIGLGLQIMVKIERY